MLTWISAGILLGIVVLLTVLLVLFGAAFYLRRRFERSW